MRGDGGNSVGGDRGYNSSPSVLLLTTGALVLATTDQPAPGASLLSPCIDTTRVAGDGGEERIHLFWCECGGCTCTSDACWKPQQLFFGGELEIVLAIVIITVTGSNRVLLHA
jgi:hypothetical protein